ncbi:hypothetical protein AQS8620_03378 [Aquimixticola soesokkakensis]|uniref:Uncharacterized protein n=1 Tax=Aquimixticola soesokkakensis TaxID=1519096 RepID=A0A1Y5TSV6_9RHOB|nr:hypothetical protein AQS8620_03378 [Aquimixticola soesokkakensis]
MDLRQVGSEHPVQSGPDIECRCVDLPTFDTGLWQRWQIFAAFELQAGDCRFGFEVAFGNLGFVEVVKI